MKHKPSRTIHVVPFRSSSLTAICGERITGTDSTGHYNPRPVNGWHVCTACAGAA